MFCLRRQDKDGKLSRAEFSTFLHPEEADHMRDVVVKETIEDIDTDGDGKISLDEYIGEETLRSGHYKMGASKFFPVYTRILL